MSENEIATALGLPKQLRKRVQSSLAELESKSLVRQNSRHRFSAAESSGTRKAGELLAVFSLKGSGNGIAREVGGARDFFVPERRRGWALSGDTVLLRRLPSRPDSGRSRGKEAPDELPAAEVLEVRERGRKEWVGELRREARQCFLVLRQGELELDLDLAEVPDAVPDGDWVVATAPGLDSGGHSPNPSRFLSHLGGKDTAHLDTLILLKKAGLKEEFSPETLREADLLPSVPQESDFQGRLDLRGQIVFTIDGADAKDFDDAVSIERTREGYRLGVHIADVSHYVRPGSALDREAYERGTSVYLPDRVLPMLPEALSNGLCSLKPDQARLTESAIMDFDAKGRMLSWRMALSLIQSVRRFTYDEVEDYFEGRGGLRPRKRNA